MRIILLSGGEGKRLWPLSNALRSKPFLRLLQDQSGERISLIQNTMKELDSLGYSDNTIVVASATHIEQVHEHLGRKVQSLVEPQRRDTFPAVALATSYLHDELGADREEVVIVMPVDSQADQSFYQLLPILEQELSKSVETKLGLIGVKPLSASVNYGYISLEHGNKDGLLSPIHQFREKPNEQTAKELVAEGALWNCGVFAFTVGYLLDLLKQRGLPQDYSILNARYEDLPANSFDYEVSEHEEAAACLPYDGNWRDVGTWDVLSPRLEEQVYGQSVINGGCSGTHVINELPIPIVISDIPDAIIVAGIEGILISSKKSSIDLKSLLAKLSSVPSQVESRTEGKCFLIDQQNVTSDELVIETSRIHLLKGEQLTTHSKAVKTIWTLTMGTGIFTSSDKQFPESDVLAGQTLQLQESGLFTASTECMLIEIATLSTVQDEVLL
ncbi:hypothetical protein PMSD_09060 [Paenibacillus macquariensis subsp. defensor]|nr:hypothetical protein PMSD_09060 [Paenibacillus macquariensis subsp. defensor]